MRNAVSDKQFELAKQNIEYKKRITSIGKMFSGQLSAEQLRYCGDMGLWKAMVHFKPKVGNKAFTSCLYDFVKWECFRAIKDNTQKHSTLEHGGNVEGEDCIQQTMTSIIAEECLSKLNERERDIVELHFFQGKTYKEIGKIYDLSKQAIMVIIKGSKDKMAKFGV